MARPSISKAPKKRFFRKLNRKGLITLGLALVVVAVGSLSWRSFNDNRLRKNALAIASGIAQKGDVDLAIRHIDRYLANWPNDLPGLELRAKLLTDAARSMDQVLEAARANDLLVRLDPDSPGRRESRRKLADLYIRYGDLVRAYADMRKDADVETKEFRYLAAINVLRKLLEKNEDDAVAHRLLAMALEGQVATGKEKSNENAKLLDESEKEFKIALRLDPKDMLASERLASLYLMRLNDPIDAELTLDAMLKSNPNSIDVRMARFRAYARSKKDDKARAELEAVGKLAPTDLLIQSALAAEALRRRDKNSTVEARRHLDAIPADQQDDLRVRVLRGMMEFAEQHSDDAIDQWRRGLTLVGGTDQELTWELAYALIKLGRLSEAKPLLTQYVRLDNDESSGMSRFLQAMYDQRSGNTSGAILNLERSRDRVPSKWRAELQLTLGRCYESLGDESRAMLAYRSAATASPQASEPRRAIARLYQNHDSEGAITELDSALSQDSTDQNLIIESIRYRLARQYKLPLERRNWTEIEELFKRTEQNPPAGFTVKGLRAEYLAASGRLPAAIDLLRKESQGPDGKHPEVWLALANGLDRLNRRAEAIQALDRGLTAEKAGDQASLRIGKAQLLLRLGKGQAACEVLTKDADKVPKNQRPDLSRVLGDILREMGDRDGARAAYAEWARLSPDIPMPGLTLLALAQLNNDDEAAKLGLQALKALGGDKEPYGLAVQALNLLRTDRTVSSAPSNENIRLAERLAERLRNDAPQLPVGFLVQGIIFEYRNDLPKAVDSYQKALKDDAFSPALPRLIEGLVKLRRFDDLAALKRKFDDQAAARQQPGMTTEFDRISTAVAIKLGDNSVAEFFASQYVAGRPDSVQARTAQAQLLETNGKPKEAEETLQNLVKGRPQDSTAWLALITFKAYQIAKAEQAKVAPEAIGRLRIELSQVIERGRITYKSERPELFLAQCYWLGKDIPTASRLYQELLKKSPADLVTLKSSSEFYENTRQPEQQEAVLRKAIQLDPSASWAARSLALLLTTRPDSVAWAEAWGLVSPGASGSGDLPEDRLVRATVLARSPENARRLEAIPAFSALIEDLPLSNPVGVDARVRLSQTMLEIKQFGDALKYILPLADDADRATPLALAIAIEALARSGNAGEAFLRLNRLVTLDPKSPRTLMAKAWVFWAQDKKSEASASILAAFGELKEDVSKEYTGVAFVDLLMSIGDLDAALKLAKQVADRWPNQTWVLAKVQFAREEFDQALATCRIALANGSAREAFRYATASALARRSDPAFVRAVEALGEEAKAKVSNDFNIYVFLGTIRHTLGKYKDEIEDYRTALKYDPTNVSFLNNMAWTISEGLNNPEEGLNRIQEAIRREGPVPQFLDTRGVIQIRRGKFKEAIADLEQSIKLEETLKIPPTASTYYHLARAHWKLKQVAEWHRYRDLARKYQFDMATLDPTDRSDLAEVMETP